MAPSLLFIAKFFHRVICICLIQFLMPHSLIRLSFSPLHRSVPVKVTSDIFHLLGLSALLHTRLLPYHPFLPLALPRFLPPDQSLLLCLHFHRPGHSTLKFPSSQTSLLFSSHSSLTHSLGDFIRLKALHTLFLIISHLYL